MPSPAPPLPRRDPAPPPSASGLTTTITTGPIPEAVLRAVLAADQAMYPAALPWARLRAWVDACPALAVCFYLPRRGPGAAVALGASVTLPLRAGPWRALLAGRLAESAITPADLRAPAGPEEEEEDDDDDEEASGDDGGGGGGVGLHVFHVERFDADDDDDDARRAGRGLAARALRHALDVAAGRGWKVLGCSGARAFAKLGFGPTGYEEIWVREAGGSGAAALARMVPILPSGPAGADRGAVREKGSDEEVVGEAKMVVRYMDGIPDARGLTPYHSSAWLECMVPSEADGSPDGRASRIPKYPTPVPPDGCIRKS